MNAIELGRYKMLAGIKTFRNTATGKSLLDNGIPYSIKNYLNYDTENNVIRVSGITLKSTNSNAVLDINLEKKEFIFSNDENRVMSRYPDHALTYANFTTDPQGNMCINHINPFSNKPMMDEDMLIPIMKMIEGSHYPTYKEPLKTEGVVIELGTTYCMSTYYVESTELHNWLGQLFKARHMHNMFLLTKIRNRVATQSEWLYRKAA